MPPTDTSIVLDAVPDRKSASILSRTMAFVLHVSDFVRRPAEQELMKNTCDKYGAAMEKVASRCTAVLQAAAPATDDQQNVINIGSSISLDIACSCSPSIE